MRVPRFLAARVPMKGASAWISESRGYVTTLLKAAAAYDANDPVNFPRLAANLYDMAAADVSKEFSKYAHKAPGALGDFLPKNGQERTSEGV